jgi:hypothetical protein
MLYSDLGNSPPERVIDLAANHWLQQRIDWIGHISGALEPGPGAAVPLGAYLQKLMGTLQQTAISDFRSAEIKGPPDGLTNEALMDYWRAAWRGFASAIAAWPEIRDAARESVR